ncbi:MAG: hypothetical protein ABSE99_09920 [Terracidiphilus sp.]|jgi:hypothetical protein
MEFTLNLAWVVLAALMICLWLRIGPRRDTDRRLQLVALAVLLLILFPVISVTDDLLAVQNPAETDSCIRRDYAISSAHSIFPAVAALPQPFLAELSFSFLRFAAPGHLPAPAVDHPGLAGIQNRPPPAA